MAASLNSLESAFGFGGLFLGGGWSPRWREARAAMRTDFSLRWVSTILESSVLPLSWARLILAAMGETGRAVVSSGDE